MVMYMIMSDSWHETSFYVCWYNMFCMLVIYVGIVCNTLQHKAMVLHMIYMPVITHGNVHYQSDTIHYHE